MIGLLSSITHSLRALARRPLFTILSVATLALGIGANCAVFSVINEVLLNPLPYASPGRVVRIWSSSPRQSFDRFEVSLPDFLDWRRQSRAFGSVAAYTASSVTLTGLGDPEVLPVAKVSANLLPTLGLRPRVGRGLVMDDEKPGAQVVLLSAGFWRRRFGGDPAVLGRQLTFNGKGYTIVGVLPGSLPFVADEAELLLPLQVDAADPGPRAARYLDVIGRLAPGASLDLARREMRDIAGGLAHEHPESNADWTVALLPMPELVVEKVRPALMVLLVAVVFVLLIACANVANLLMVRTTSRGRELAVRQALGTSPMRLAGQLTGENLILALMGGALGLLLGAWSIKGLVHLASGYLPHLKEVAVDGRLLLFAFGISLLTVLLSGLLPVLQALRIELNEALKEGSRSVGSGQSSRRVREVLVVAEVALAVILLFGSLLLLRSFWQLQSVDPGFQPRGILVARLSLPPSRYADAAVRSGFYQQVVNRIRALPGVIKASTSNALPLHDWYFGFQIQGRTPPRPGEEPQVLHRVVGPDYFACMQIRLLRGRVFTDHDRIGAPGVAIIDETAARRYFPAEDPLGKRISFAHPPEWLEIIGVVGEVRQLGPAAAPVPGAYVSALQTAPPRMYLLVRSAANPKALIFSVRNQVRALDPTVPVYDVQTMTERLADSISQPRFNTWLLGIFSLLALSLAVIGIYGVLAYSVNQRRFEIGTRIALGAEPRHILHLILSQGLRLIGIGMALGLAAAFALSKLLTGFLFQVHVTDPLVIVAVPLILGLVAVLACYVPARRATGIDPILVLRSESG